MLLVTVIVKIKVLPGLAEHLLLNTLKVMDIMYCVKIQ
jgi:hypothetical protein